MAGKRAAVEEDEVLDCYSSGWRYAERGKGVGSRFSSLGNWLTFAYLYIGKGTTQLLNIILLVRCGWRTAAASSPVLSCDRWLHPSLCWYDETELRAPGALYNIYLGARSTCPYYNTEGELAELRHSLSVSQSVSQSFSQPARHGRSGRLVDCSVRNILNRCTHVVHVSVGGVLVTVDMRTVKPFGIMTQVMIIAPYRIFWRKIAATKKKQKNTTETGN